MEKSLPKWSAEVEKEQKILLEVSMLSNKPYLMLCLGATLCAAQPIAISGTVINKAGAGLAGATVKLENANLSTMTDADGSFSFKRSNSLQPATGQFSRAVIPVRLQNGKMKLFLSENTLVSVTAHDVGGRLLFSSRKMYSAGTHVFPFSSPTHGIRLYMVTLGQKVYVFKSATFGTFSTGFSSEDPSTPGTFLTKQAKVSAIINDIIFVAKEGQLNYRDSMRTSDTSGIVIKMVPNAGNVADAAGNVYQTVRIGNLVWTVENLKTASYNDSTSIALVTDSAQWRNLATGAYCYYGNDTANKSKYGALYNWPALNAGKLAPPGWRVPRQAEWDTLQNYLIAKGYNWDDSTSGKKFAKSMAAKTDWNSISQKGAIGNDMSRNNATGFCAFPVGYRFGDGRFDFRNTNGAWWSGSETGTSNPTGRFLSYDREDLGVYQNVMNYGFSVRLVHDYPYGGGFVFIPGRTPVSVHGKLHIEGNKFLDEHNRVVTLRGMSMYDWGDKGKQFYTAPTVMHLAQDWGCTVLRIPILPENANETKPGNHPPAPVRLKTVVDACIANGIYAIIDWHSMNAANATNASAFFTEMANLYGNTPNVMYELWNEPVDETWPVIKAYCEKVITAIRAVDTDNIILCGSKWYDQRLDEPAADPITISKNIAYTFHFYAYTHKVERFGKDVTTALKAGLAVFSTEYAGCRSDGNGPYDLPELLKWWNYLDTNNIGCTNWAMETNAETASVFVAAVDKNVTGPWTDAELTQPGKDMKAYIQGTYNETVMAP